MGAVGTSKNTKKKIGKKSKKATATKLKIRLNKYSEDLKAKRKEMVQQWKVSMVFSSDSGAKGFIISFLMHVTS